MHLPNVNKIPLPTLAKLWQPVSDHFKTDHEYTAASYKFDQVIRGAHLV